MSKISILLVSIIIFPCVVFAQQYTVKKGDNIWQISKKFNVSVSDIKKANNLTSNKLQIGMKLEIPQKNEKITKKSNQIEYHIVKKDENLFRIAKKYNMSIEELKNLNGLTSNKLNIGQKLIVKASAKPQENISSNISIRENEKVPILASATKLDINEKAVEIENIKASEDISQMSLTERLLLFAKKMLHLPYRFGGNSFYGLDCSFFVKKVYSMIGIELPRSAREQFTVGIPVSKDELKPGDLVFFRTYAKFPSHVGIYLGDNLFIHASTKSKKVTIDSLETPYYLSRYIGAKRILDIDRETIEKAIEQLTAN